MPNAGTATYTTRFGGIHLHNDITLLKLVHLRLIRRSSDTIDGYDACRCRSSLNGTGLKIFSSLAEQDPFIAN